MQALQGQQMLRTAKVQALLFQERYRYTSLTLNVKHVHWKKNLIPANVIFPGTCATEPSQITSWRGLKFHLQMFWMKYIFRMNLEKVFCTISVTLSMTFKDYNNVNIVCKGKKNPNIKRCFWRGKQMWNMCCVFSAGTNWVIVLKSRAVLI